MHRGSWNAGQRRDNKRLSRGCWGTGRITEGEAGRLRVTRPKVHLQKYVLLLKHARTHRIQQFSAEEGGILRAFAARSAWLEPTEQILLCFHNTPFNPCHKCATSFHRVCDSCGVMFISFIIMMTDRVAFLSSSSTPIGPISQLASFHGLLVSTVL